MKRKWQIRENLYWVNVYFIIVFTVANFFLEFFFFPLIIFSKYRQLTKDSSKRMFSLSYSLLALSYSCDLFIIINGIVFFFLDLDRAKHNCFTHLYTKRNAEISKHSFFFFYVVSQKCNVPIYPGQHNHIKWFPKI